EVGLLALDAHLHTNFFRLPVRLDHRHDVRPGRVVADRYFDRERDALAVRAEPETVVVPLGEAGPIEMLCGLGEVELGVLLRELLVVEVAFPARRVLPWFALLLVDSISNLFAVDRI